MPTFLTAPGQSYTVTAAVDDVITDESGVQLAECPAGVQTVFVAISRSVTFADADTVVVQNYIDGPGGGGTGGGGGTVDQVYNPTSANAQSGRAVSQAVDEQAQRVSEHVDDMTLHTAPAYRENLDWLIANFGRRPQEFTYVHSTIQGEGNWDYLPDTALQSYVGNAARQAREGYNFKVYGCLFPEYSKSNASEYTPGTTTAINALPVWCNGIPWLFDSLVDDGNGGKRHRRWAPSTALEGGSAIDEYQGEYLWDWWNCNYVRCDNGNRRIVGVQGLQTTDGIDSYKEEGDVDVGVMFPKYYAYYGVVEVPMTTPTTGTTGKFVLAVIASGPMDDERFPAEYREMLTAMGVTKLVLPKSCQRLVDGTTIPEEAPYGVYAKYNAVLAGSDPNNLTVRSQRGHLLVNISHNGFAASKDSTSKTRDGAYVKSTHQGFYNFAHKGLGYHGSGMDRILFIILRLMIKSGTKNLQRDMSGMVTTLRGGSGCKATKTAAQFHAMFPEIPVLGSSQDNNPKYAGMRLQSFVMPRSSAQYFAPFEFVTTGTVDTRDFGYNANRKQWGQVVEKIDRVYTSETGETSEYTEIVLRLMYDSVPEEYTDAWYMTQQIPPCGVTDVLPTKKDGAPYVLVQLNNSTSNQPASPCRMMGLEYGIGALPIYMDIAFVYDENSYGQLYWCPPDGREQLTLQGITDPDAGYTHIGLFAGTNMGSIWVADITVDLEKGVFCYSQTNSGSDQRGFRDQFYRDGSTVKNDARQVLGFGSVYWVAGSASGPVCTDVSGSYYTALTASYWCFCSCD